MKILQIADIDLTELLYRIEEIFEKQIQTHVSETPTINSELPEWSTREQVAKYLGVTKPTLWKWSKEGKINSYKIVDSDLVRYKRDDVLQVFQKVKNQKYKRD